VLHSHLARRGTVLDRSRHRETVGRTGPTVLEAVQPPANSDFFWAESELLSSADCSPQGSALKVAAPCSSRFFLVNLHESSLAAPTGLVLVVGLPAVRISSVPPTGRQAARARRSPRLLIGLIRRPLRLSGQSPSGPPVLCPNLCPGGCRTATRFSNLRPLVERTANSDLVRPRLSLAKDAVMAPAFAHPELPALGTPRHLRRYGTIPPIWPSARQCASTAVLVLASTTTSTLDRWTPRTAGV
jgi:hypothetical protein